MNDFASHEFLVKNKWYIRSRLRERSPTVTKRFAVRMIT